MKNKFSDLGISFALPTALKPMNFEIPSSLMPMATAKPSFMGARPGLLLPQSFEVPIFNKNNAPVPQSTRGLCPIQLPITPSSTIFE